MYAYLREIESKYTVQDDYLKGFVTTGIKVFSTGIQASPHLRGQTPFVGGF